MPPQRKNSKTTKKKIKIPSREENQNRCFEFGVKKFREHQKTVMKKMLNQFAVLAVHGTGTGKTPFAPTGHPVATAAHAFPGGRGGQMASWL